MHSFVTETYVVHGHDCSRLGYDIWADRCIDTCYFIWCTDKEGSVHQHKRLGNQRTKYIVMASYLNILLLDMDGKIALIYVKRFLEFDNMEIVVLFRIFFQ